MRPFKSLLLAFLAWWATLIFAAGCTAPKSTARQPQDETPPAMQIFCRLGEQEWRRVVAQEASGVLLAGESLSFAQVWHSDLTAKTPPPGPRERRSWQELLLPLPDEAMPCIGYAFTYPEHQRETSLTDVLSFAKNAVPQSALQDIAYRQHLDYEAEIGLLLQRSAPGRFGYLMVNDLTDRGIQVRTFDPDDMGRGFGLAKSFEGALRVGPLLAIGNEAAWQTLAVDLYLNGERRQQLRASACLLRPGAMAAELLAAHPEASWLLVATGTSEGMLFDVPNLWEKIEYFLRAGFSMKEAQEAWLAHLRFLQPGDELILRSPTLGRASARVVTKESR